MLRLLRLLLLRKRKADIYREGEKEIYTEREREREGDIERRREIYRERERKSRFIEVAHGWNSSIRPCACERGLFWELNPGPLAP